MREYLDLPDDLKNIVDVYYSQLVNTEKYDRVMIELVNVRRRRYYRELFWLWWYRHRCNHMFWYYVILTTYFVVLLGLVYVLMTMPRPRYKSRCRRFYNDMNGDTYYLYIEC